MLGIQVGPQGSQPPYWEPQSLICSNTWLGPFVILMLTQGDTCHFSLSALGDG